MQQYDIASKILMETCRDDIIRHFAGIDVAESALIEQLPQETPSLKRSDFPIMVTDRQGDKCLALFELQTEWNRRVPLNLMDYRARYLMKYDVRTVSYVILLKPSGAAVNVYEDNEIRFTYNLIRVYDLDAREIINHGPLCLAPFVPLMKHGRELLHQADDLIYKSERSRSEKADMLTSMAILSGIVSKELPIELINRRKDIMIESAAYDIIKQDGIKEGMIFDAKEMLMEAIMARFETVPDDISGMIGEISDRNILKLMLKEAIKCNGLDALRQKLMAIQ